MGRKRRRINQGLPRHVYKTKRGYIYRAYLGREGGKTLSGPDVLLGGPDAPMSHVYAAYEAATGSSKDTLTWLLTAYSESPAYQKLKPRTRADYETYAAIILAREIRGGTFGRVQLKAIKKTTIRAYLDTYKDGAAPIAANRHIQYLKAAWSWAEQRYDHVPPNPCKGVTLNEQTPRTRHVTPEEYAAIHQHTKGWLTWAMELAYLCRARRQEILALRVSDIREEGLRLVRAKGSEGEITAWTPRLRAAVDGALKHSYPDTKPLGSALLLLGNHRQKITASAWSSALQRLYPIMDKLGIERFTLHDLKAAGISAQKDNWGGHRSEKMRKVYVRKLQIVEPPE